jgi:Asp-tRNA(Asn)/Glu-tRNA(Gln) amidotransferase A subunit family amidase
LKPTYGLVPVEGVHPVAPSHDTVGILAGSLHDLFSTFHALIGQVETSATAAPPHKLLVIRTPGFDQIDEPTRLAFEAMLGDARSQFAIDDWRSDAGQALDALFTGADMLLLDIMGWEIQWPYGDYERNYGTLLSQDIRGLLTRGRALGKQRYLGLLKRKAEIQRLAAAIAKSYGAVLTLSASGVAPMGHDFTGSRSFPIPWSLVGGPSLSAPLLSVEGLPVGVQIMGLPGREQDVFEISQTLAACVKRRTLAQAP